MLMIDNSPKGFPFRYKIIDDSLTIKFDLNLLALCPCHGVAYDMPFDCAPFDCAQGRQDRRFSANLPFLWRFVLYQTPSKCSMKI